MVPQCVVSPHRNAVVDADHRIFVNHEVFYVAGEDERERFVADPLKYCGILTDPVTRQRFEPTSSCPRLDHAGRMFYFLSDSTETVFASDPEMYAYPKYGMTPKTGE